MKMVKCKTITWIGETPPLREIELEESEAERLASLGYLRILREQKETPIPKEEELPVPVSPVDEQPPPAEKKKTASSRKKQTE